MSSDQLLVGSLSTQSKSNNCPQLFRIVIAPDLAKNLNAAGQQCQSTWQNRKGSCSVGDN